MLSENIVQIAEKIKQLQQRVDERRNVWSQTTKPQIKKCLEKLCKEIDLDLRVAENELRKNFSSVQLSFGLAPSGVIEGTPGGSYFRLRSWPAGRAWIRDSVLVACDSEGVSRQKGQSCK